MILLQYSCCWTLAFTWMFLVFSYYWMRTWLLSPGSLFGSKLLDNKPLLKVWWTYLLPSHMLISSLVQSIRVQGQGKLLRLLSPRDRVLSFSAFGTGRPTCARAVCAVSFPTLRSYLRWAAVWAKSGKVILSGLIWLMLFIPQQWKVLWPHSMHIFMCMGLMKKSFSACWNR